MKRNFVLLLTIGAAVMCVPLRAYGTSYYVDCNYGSNGYLPVADAYWPVYSGNVWVSKPLFDDNGSGSDNCANDSNCVPCPVQGILYSCLSQALDGMGFVRFGTVWGNAAASVAAMSQDRDWFFDPNAQLLYVYCAECSTKVMPPDFYGQVVPIASPETMLNLKNVQYVEVQHLLMDWFTGYGVQVQGTSDQPGRMRLAEDRIWALEKNDIKRATYDRIVTAAIAFAVSALITLHERFLPK